MQSKSEGRPVANQIIHSVADAEGVAPDDLLPLAEVIDPAALNTLFSHPSNTAKEFRFEYEGYTVRIDGRGDVVLSNEAISKHK